MSDKPRCPYCAEYLVSDGDVWRCEDCETRVELDENFVKGEKLA